MTGISTSAGTPIFAFAIIIKGRGYYRNGVWVTL
jgi:hypothetical protein